MFNIWHGVHYDFESNYTLRNERAKGAAVWVLCIEIPASGVDAPRELACPECSVNED